MAFIVQFKDGTTVNQGDDKAYEFIDGGVLSFGSKHGKVYYAPGVWERVDAGEDHGPGVTKGGGRIW